MEVSKIAVLLILAAVLLPQIGAAITNGDFVNWGTGWTSYTTGGSSVTFYGDPQPDPYVRLTGRNGTALIYQAETEFDASETWEATFVISSFASGLGDIVTIGWSDDFGDYGSYYREISSAGTYTVSCDNPSYYWVSVQLDAGIITSTIDVDEISTQDVSTPPDPTDVPMYDFEGSTEGWGFTSGLGFGNPSSSTGGGTGVGFSASSSSDQYAIWESQHNSVPYFSDSDPSRRVQKKAFCPIVRDFKFV